MTNPDLEPTVWPLPPEDAAPIAPEELDNPSPESLRIASRRIDIDYAYKTSNATNTNVFSKSTGTTPSLAPKSATEDGKKSGSSKFEKLGNPSDENNNNNKDVTSHEVIHIGLADENQTNAFAEIVDNNDNIDVSNSETVAADYEGLDNNDMQNDNNGMDSGAGGAINSHTSLVDLFDITSTTTTTDYGVDEVGWLCCCWL